MKKIPLESIWRVFAKQFRLSARQIEQFGIYIHELLAWNAQMNLTAARDERELVELHCADALALTRFIDPATVKTLCDIGAGGGFPGVPLSIVWPERKVYLLEVKHKKIQFLEHAVRKLGLSNVAFITLDWRTFLRKPAEEPIDLFCARASLDPDELVRVFKPSSPYNNARLVYWASEMWVPTKKIEQYVDAEYWYQVGNRRRRLIFFKRNASTHVEEPQ